MIIEASVNTKAVSPSKTRKKDLRDFVGKLKLEATSHADMVLLRAMYNECFGRAENKGSIKVFDAQGKEVCNYFYEKQPESTERA
jgi:hypothetical protein